MLFSGWPCWAFSAMFLAFPCAHAAPSAAPKGVIGTGEGYTSIVVAWQPLPVEDHNGELQGYLIRYKITVFPEATTSYTNVTSAATFIYTLRDLIVFTEYELSVAAYNLAGVGPYSHPIQACTREGFPTVPPSQLRAIDITTTTIEILWYPPHPQFINGKLLGHKVTIGETQSGGSSPAMTYVIAIDPDNSLGTQSYIASGLRSGVEYSIQVLAFTSAGEGPSTGISVRTQGSSTLPPETTVNVTGTTTAPTKITTTEAVNITSRTPAPVNITGTTPAPVNITGTTTAPVNITGTTTAPVNIASTTTAPVNITSTTTAPVTITSRTPAPVAITSTTTEAVNVTTIEAVNVTSKTTAPITPKPDLVTGITEEPDLVTGTTEEPDLVTRSVPTVEVVTSNISSTVLPTHVTSNVWPMFETCPKNITVYTSIDRREVWWVQPTAKDAQGRKLSNVMPNIAPGFIFYEGVTTVTYSAADDQNRNLQTCRFYVHVVQQEFACLNAPAPRNGRLRCSEVNFFYQCSVMCDSGYLSTSSYHGAHLCRTTGWTPPFAAGFNSAACQRHVPVREKNTLTLTFEGSYPGDSATLRESFARSLETLFRTAGLCRAEQNDTVQQQSCDWRNFDVICTSTAAGGRRRKRADNEIKLDILIWFTEDEANTDMHQKVHSREMELQDFIDHNKLHLVVDGDKYLGTGLSALPRAMGCPPGWVQMDNNKGCLECPAGTYHDATVGECVPCAQGFYQNRTSQPSCIMCTAVIGSPEGAISRNQCYYKPIEASTKTPGVFDSNNSIWIVVGICIAGWILLVAIIVAVVAIHRMCCGKKGEAYFEDIHVALAKGHTGKMPMEDCEVAYPSLRKSAEKVHSALLSEVLEEVPKKRNANRRKCTGKCRKTACAIM